MSAIQWRRPKHNLAGYVGGLQVAVVFRVYDSTDYGWWLYGNGPKTLRSDIIASGRCATEREAIAAAEAKYAELEAASAGGEKPATGE